MIARCSKCKGPVSPLTGYCSRCGAAGPLTLEWPPLPPLPGLPPLPSLASLPTREASPVCVTCGTAIPIESLSRLPDGTVKHIGCRGPAHAPACVLVADPPWRFKDKNGATGAGAAKHYNTMPVEEVKAFPLPPLADNAVLFLWRVEALGRQCYEVAEAWGFEPKSKLTWRKTRACKVCEGRGYMPVSDMRVWCEPCKGRGRVLVVGMGNYTRRGTEDCIIAVRRGVKPTACHPQVHDVRDIFDAPRGEHSAKPDRFYEIVEQLYPGPYVELFARRRRPGWVAFGDELPAEEVRA